MGKGEEEGRTERGVEAELKKRGVEEKKKFSCATT